jgi:tRNA A37 methylthiotransferase MiaB
LREKKMKVKELISVLKTKDPEAEVIVAGCYAREIDTFTYGGDIFYIGEEEHYEHKGKIAIYGSE